MRQYGHDENINKLCTEYSDVKGTLEALNKKKDGIRARLDTVTRGILTMYQDRINHYLEIFGAEFRIVDKVSTVRGRAHAPSVEYKIKIGNTSIPLGDAETPESTPCFKNTLSDGDKNTLAFAFFIAKLDMDAELANKVIVFDDPINSLDIHRKRATKQEIVKKAAAAKQIIVLTHDQSFARSIFDSFDKTQLKCLCVEKQSVQESTIREWKIIEETATEYFVSYRNLEAVLADGTGEILGIARSIRPVLEGHLRNSFPTIFDENMWLGDFIREIRAADDDSLLKSLQGAALQELSDINDYSKDFHHTSFNPSTISPTELRTYATRTIKFLGRQYVA